MFKNFLLIVLVYNNLLICTDEDKKLEEDKNIIELEEGLRKRTATETGTQTDKQIIVQAFIPRGPQSIVITRSRQDFARQETLEKLKTIHQRRTLICLLTFVTCCFDPLKKFFNNFF